MREDLVERGERAAKGSGKTWSVGWSSNRESSLSTASRRGSLSLIPFRKSRAVTTGRRERYIVIAERNSARRTHVKPIFVYRNFRYPRFSSLSSIRPKNFQQFFSNRRGEILQYTILQPRKLSSIVKRKMIIKRFFSSLQRIVKKTVEGTISEQKSFSTGPLFLLLYFQYFFKERNNNNRTWCNEISYPKLPVSILVFELKFRSMIRYVKKNFVPSCLIFFSIKKGNDKTIISSVLNRTKRLSSVTVQPDK